MKALLYHGPRAQACIPAQKRGTHRFTLDQVDEAYEVFAQAAADSALKAILSPA